MNEWSNTPQDGIGWTYRRVLMRDPCVYCGDDATGLDHIRPRSSYTPGPNSRKYWKWLNSWENRAPACSRCDSEKGKTSLLLYLRMLTEFGHIPRTKRQDKQQARLVKVQKRLGMRCQ